MNKQPQYYETLDGGVFDLKQLSPTHQRFYNRLKAYFDTNPDWSEFGHFWTTEGQKVWGHLSGKEIVQLPLWKMAQDMDGRLGLQQGIMRSDDKKRIPSPDGRRRRERTRVAAGS